MDIFNAIENTEKVILEDLIKKGIDVNSADECGQTPLHLAIDISFEEAINIYYTENKFIQPKLNLIEILLKNGANPYIKDNKGQSPIEWAEDRKNEKFLIDLKELIKKYTAHNNV